MNSNKDYTTKLEGVIKQMLTPIKGIPFNLIIESISGCKVLEFSKEEKDKKAILDTLIKIITNTCKNVNKDGILRPRPNEVGNDIETFVVESIVQSGFIADKPKTKTGKQQSVGYPDIEFSFDKKNFHYIECKTYNHDTVGTSMRSFYLSPSEDFKITHDAYHFIFSFETYIDGKVEKNNRYKICGWKILDAYYLDCDVKYEFNSDNARLYRKEMILAEGKI